MANILLSGESTDKTKEEGTFDHPPRAPTNGRLGFPFGFPGAGGRLPKASERRKLQRRSLAR